VAAILVPFLRSSWEHVPKVEPPLPAVITQVVFSEGTEAKLKNTGSIRVQPWIPYEVSFELLRNDLESETEKALDVVVDGLHMGECNPDGRDTDCTFYQCKFDNQKKVITPQVALIDVAIHLQDHSKDCDCDKTTWECSQEDTVPGRTPMTAVGRFTLTPQAITQVVFSEGTVAKTENAGSIHAQPGVTYEVSFELLRNDLGGVDEKALDVIVDGLHMGECNPDGEDTDCTFYQCTFDDQTKFITPQTGLIHVAIHMQEHSKDCDCDKTTWECSQEDTVPGRTPMTAVGRFTLTPQVPATTTMTETNQAPTKKRIQKVDHTWSAVDNATMSVRKGDFVNVWVETGTDNGWITCDDVSHDGTSRVGWLPIWVLDTLPEDRQWMRVKTSWQASEDKSQRSVEAGSHVIVWTLITTNEGWAFVESDEDEGEQPGWIPVYCLEWFEDWKRKGKKGSTQGGDDLDS